jgi:hypothetical protein
MIVTAAMVGGAARRIVVEFPGTFGSCAASVAVAKEEGSKIIKTFRIRTGQELEISSVRVSGATCTVHAGNVFAK